MKTVFKTLIASSVAVIIAGAASADDVVEAEFRYNRDEPIATLYAGFEDTARDACRITYREAGGLSAKRAIERNCREDLLAKAVQIINDPVLTAFHNGDGDTRRLYAGLNLQG